MFGLDLPSQNIFPEEQTQGGKVERSTPGPSGAGSIWGQLCLSAYEVTLGTGQN